MAERKAVNKYYPPEWTPNKGSINKFRGSHPLRERARKLNQGILIIRFEMPYNIWCEGCKNHIGMGVRYNAEKTKVGMYYTTLIYKFRMKCHLCDSHFEMQTDPQNLDYVILNGASRQERRWDPDENEQVAPEEKAVSAKLATDAMYKLEHGVDDKEKKKTVAPQIVSLEEIQDRWKDDYTMNQMLRRKFRNEKKEIKSKQEKDKLLLTRSSLSIPLLPESDDDKKLAGLLRLESSETFEDKEVKKINEIVEESIFSSKKHASPLLAKGLKGKLATLSLQKKVATKSKPLFAAGLVKRKVESSTTEEPRETKPVSLVTLDYGSTDSE